MTGRKRLRRINKDELLTPIILFQVWCEAAAEYRRMQSDPTEARCRVARAAWYQAVWDTVPPLPEGESSAKGAA